MKHLDTKQIQAILEAARDNSTRDWAMLLLTFRHALRSSEVRSLKIDDISLVDGTIRIERKKGSISGVQTLDAHKGKPLLDEYVALRAWFKERVEDGSRILFPSQKGGMMTRMQLGRIFKARCFLRCSTTPLAIRKPGWSISCCLRSIQPL